MNPLVASAVVDFIEVNAELGLRGRLQKTSITFHALEVVVVDANQRAAIVEFFDIETFLIVFQIDQNVVLITSHTIPVLAVLLAKGNLSRDALVIPQKEHVCALLTLDVLGGVVLAVGHAIWDVLRKALFLVSYKVVLALVAVLVQLIINHAVSDRLEETFDLFLFQEVVLLAFLASQFVLVIVIVLAVGNQFIGSLEHLLYIANTD